MKKFKLLLSMTLIFLVLSTNAFAFSSNQISIRGEVVDLRNPILETSENVFISLRELGEVLGYSVSWNNEERAIALKNGDKEYYFKVNSNIVNTNGYGVEYMSSNAFIQEGLAYIPLNAVDDVFDLTLEKSESYYVVKNGSYETVGSKVSIEELYQLALANSESLDTAERNVDRYEITEDEASDDINNSTPSTTGNGAQDASRLSAFQAYEAQGIALEMSKRTVETTKEEIYHSLLTSIESILLESERLELSAESLEVYQITYNQSKLKYELGLISKLDLDSSRIDFENAQKNVEIQKLTLENKWIDLNEMVGKAPEDRYTFDYTLEFTPLIEENLEGHISWVVSKSPDLWNLEQQIQLAENSIRFYVFNAGGDPYDAEEIDVALAKINLRSAKKTLEESMRTMYNSIGSLEENQTKLLLAVEDAKNDLKLAKSNYEVGLATELQLKSAQLALESAQMNLMDNMVTHNSTVRVYETPWISN